MRLLHRSPRPGHLSCRQVGKVLQQYLDGHTDGATSRKVAEHLEDCYRCGLESEVYQEIKASLAREVPEVPKAALERLRQFSHQLVDDEGGP